MKGDFKERRAQKRYVVIEDVSKIIKDLKSKDIMVDLSLKGAKILSLAPKKIGEITNFSITLPKELGSLEIKGKNVRSKMVKINKKNVFETGVLFEPLNDIDTATLRNYIGYLQRHKIILEGREKIKELLAATKKLKRNLLILKCSLEPKKESDTTQ